MKLRRELYDCEEKFSRDNCLWNKECMIATGKCAGIAPTAALTPQHITYFFKDGTVGVTKLSREVCSGAIFTKMKVNLFLTIPHRLVLTESSHFLVPRRESKDKIFRSQDFEDFWRFCVDFEPKLDCKSQPWQLNAFIFPLDSVFPDLKMPDSKIRWPLYAFCHRIDPNCTVF